MDGHSEYLSYVHTDADLPPVAIIDRSPIGARQKIFFGLIAILGAVAWTVIAFVRGEAVNAVWSVVAAICTYVIGDRFYARLIEAKIVRPRDEHATPVEVLDYLGSVRPGRVTEVSAIGFVLLTLTVVSGHYVGETSWGALWLKVGAIARAAVGICIAHPTIQAPAVSLFATHDGGPVFFGSLFSFLFITIACGALSALTTEQSAIGSEFTAVA